MTNPHPAPHELALTLAERLAPMTIAEIDAMGDQGVAERMGATPEEIATEPAWTWRGAAKAATNEYADKLISDLGPSMQVRMRVTTSTRAALEAIAAAQGRRLADVSRDALDEYVDRHAS